MYSLRPLQVEDRIHDSRGPRSSAENCAATRILGPDTHEGGRESVFALAIACQLNG